MRHTLDHVHAADRVDLQPAQGGHPLHPEHPGGFESGDQIGGQGPQLLTIAGPLGEIRQQRVERVRQRRELVGAFPNQVGRHGLRSRYWS